MAAARRRGLRRRAARLAAVAGFAAVFGLGAAAPALAGPVPIPLPGGGIVDLPTDCKPPPATQVAGTGVSGGFIDPPPAAAPPPGDPFGSHPTTTVYDQYGYAGMTWGTYDLGCEANPANLPGATSAAFDTTVGNVIFGFAKVIVATTNTVHNWVSPPSWMAGLDPMVTQATRCLRNALFTPWVGVMVAVLALTLLFKATRADLPGIVTAGGWALIVLGLVAGLTSYPAWAGHQSDVILTSTISSLDAGFTGPAGEARASRAHASLLVDAVLYQQWLRGEFGSSTSATATTYGPQLFQAGALTYRQSRLPPKALASLVAGKQAQWAKIASKVQDSDPAAYQVLQGKAGVRIGTAALTVLVAVITCTFDLVASMVIMFALLLVRVSVIVLPAVAVIGLHHSQRHTITGLLTRAAGIMYSAVLWSAAAGVDQIATKALLGNDLLPLPLALLLLAILPIALAIAVRKARGRRAIPRPLMVAAGYLGLTRGLRRGAQRGARRGAREGVEEGLGEALEAPEDTGMTWTATVVRDRPRPLATAGAGGSRRARAVGASGGPGPGPLPTAERGGLPPPPGWDRPGRFFAAPPGGPAETTHVDAHGRYFTAPSRGPAAVGYADGGAGGYYSGSARLGDPPAAAPATLTARRVAGSDSEFEIYGGSARLGDPPGPGGRVCTVCGGSGGWSEGLAGGMWVCRECDGWGRVGGGGGAS